MIKVNIYKSLIAALDAGKKAVLVTTMTKNEDRQTLPQKTLFTEEDLNNPIPADKQEEFLIRKAQKVLISGNLQLLKGTKQELVLVEPYFPEPRLIVLGGGHIAQPLAEFGAKTGFSVTIVDDRPSFANTERFPDADTVLCESFDRCFDVLNVGSSAFVVIVTRGHRHDLKCLRQTLRYNTAYTGMIGSERRVQGIKTQLLTEGVSQEKLDAVYSPIGLDIGAVTPEEIALAIIAQVIRVRRVSSALKNEKGIQKANWPEYDREVLVELSKEEEDPKALVTVVAATGSVPRNPGAKMIVWPYGKIIGSIGGGCSEGEVINIARDVIRKGGYHLQRIDMTASIAEEEGMVCGGIMQALIEYYGV